MDMSRPDPAAMVPATKRVLEGNVSSLRQVCSESLAVSRARQQTPIGPDRKLSSGETRDCQGATSGTRGALSPASDAKSTLLRSFFLNVPAPSCSDILVFLSLPLFLLESLVLPTIYLVSCITRCLNRLARPHPTSYASKTPFHKKSRLKHPSNCPIFSFYNAFCMLQLVQLNHWIVLI